MSRKETKTTLAEHQLAPKKRFGQNFLVHQKTAQAIASSGNIDKSDTIVEVGVGLGALTMPLANLANSVIGLEIDSGIVRYHEENGTLPDNVTLIHDDVLKVDFHALAQDCGGKLKIMANLPYSISNPFVFKLIENYSCIDWVVVMLQKEMAERLMAKPSTKAYGIPTVLVGAHASVKKLMRLKPEEFHPRPKIDSLVVRIDFSQHSSHHSKLPHYNTGLFQQVVRSAFAQRRKTLENNLANGNFFGKGDKREEKRAVLKVIEDSGLNPQNRAENLTIADFAMLTVSMERFQQG